MLNDKMQEVFPYQHAWLTADEIDQLNCQRSKNDNDDLLHFQATLWAMALVPSEIS